MQKVCLAAGETQLYITEAFQGGTGGEWSTGESAVRCECGESNQGLITRTVDGTRLRWLSRQTTAAAPLGDGISQTQT